MCVLCIPVYEREHACAIIYIWKSEDIFRCWFISSPLQQISGDSLSVSHSHHMNAVIDVCFYGEGRRRRRRKKRRRKRESENKSERERKYETMNFM